MMCGIHVQLGEHGGSRVRKSLVASLVAWVAFACKTCVHLSPFSPESCTKSVLTVSRNLESRKVAIGRYLGR